MILRPLWFKAWHLDNNFVRKIGSERVEVQINMTVYVHEYVILCYHFNTCTLRSNGRGKGTTSWHFVYFRCIWRLVLLSRYFYHFIFLLFNTIRKTGLVCSFYFGCIWEYIQWFLMHRFLGYCWRLFDSTNKRGYRRLQGSWYGVDSNWRYQQIQRSENYVS